MIDSNFLYVEEKDILYLLIYKLGKGSYSTVWYSIEIENFFSKIKNKKILKFTPKALKIHHSDSYDIGIIETEINKILVDSNKKKCPNINYPTSHFVYDDEYVIVVYEVAIGSLYDVMKEFDKKLPLEFVSDIIPQLIKPLEFVHKCKYIHTDIKPENYLLMGTNQLQKDILEFVLNYGLGEKLKRIGNLKKFKKSDIKDKILQEILIKFLNLVSKKFNLSGNILCVDPDDNSTDNYNDNDNDNDNEDDSNDDLDSNVDLDTDLDTDTDTNTNTDTNSNSEHSFYSNISDEEKESDYETVSSYDSRDNEYFKQLDIFHTDTIVKMLFEIEANKNNNNNNNNNNNQNINREKNNDYKKNLIQLEKEKKIKYLKQILKNPIIKLTDFGTMINFTDTKSTFQTRYYRSPEIILGLDFNEKIDLWSLGCTIYELVTGKILFYTCKNNLIKKYDVDLLNIKMIFEKISQKEQDKLFKIIQISKRKKYFLTKKNNLNYFSQIEYNCWEKDLINLSGNNNTPDHIGQFIKIISCLLNITPGKRSYS
jgi:serine/threonine-protein kinase SRPK3